MVAGGLHIYCHLELSLTEFYVLRVPCRFHSKESAMIRHGFRTSVRYSKHSAEEVCRMFHEHTGEYIAAGPTYRTSTRDDVIVYVRDKEAWLMFMLTHSEKLSKIRTTTWFDWSGPVPFIAASPRSGKSMVNTHWIRVLKTRYFK